MESLYNHGTTDNKWDTIARGNYTAELVRLVLKRPDKKVFNVSGGGNIL